MGRKSKKNYYGVLIGREGPKVYSSWTQCEEAVSGFSMSRYAGFSTREEAEAWVNKWLSADAPAQSLSSDYPEPLCGSENPSESQLSPLGTSPNHHQGQQLHLENAAYHYEDPTSDASDGITLSAEQKYVLERVKRGESIFFTGSAGTGKSILLRKIIETLGGPSSSLAVTASTGIAAVNIGGTTLHSFAGVGLGKGKVDMLIQKIIRSKSSLERWQSTKTLIIDEVSMIDGRFFDTLELIARSVRNVSSPFGGIQLVLSGDFCQLPPVPDQLDGVSFPIKFAFEANSWNKCTGSPIILHRVFRQEDKEFVRMLNRMRYGTIEREDEHRFLALSRSLVYDDGIEPTELFPLRQEVERANAIRLANLPDPSHTYVSLDIPGRDSRGKPLSPQQAERLLERLVAVKQNLQRQTGAQVMLIKNLSPRQLVNGLLGKVIAFKSVPQALSDHNEFSVPDVSQVNKHGKFGIGESSFPDKDMTTSRERSWPLVRFTNGHEVLCVPVMFDVVNARGESEATRDQIPLILAWAMSVHKSQGQTLERVKVNLDRTFEKGQAYVALSRAKRMETLQVLHFNRSKVMAHPRVLEWNARVTREIQLEEEAAIIQEMDSEEAMNAFFKDDDDDDDMI